MVREREIGSGDGAVRTTVSEMCRLAQRDSVYPEMAVLAERIRRRGRGDHRRIVREAFRHVVRTVPYRSDPPGIEEVTAPKYSLRLQAPAGEVRKYWKPGGDCDDQATALVSLLGALGYDCWIKVIAWRVREYTHVFVTVRLPDGSKMPLDAVVGMRGFAWEKPGVIRSEETACPMILRTLEDGPGLAGCGGRCGGNCGGRCGNRRTRHDDDHSPVNVVVNTGSISADTQARFSAQQGGGRNGSGTRYVRERIREKPIVQRQVISPRYYVKQPAVRMPNITMPAPEVTIHPQYTVPPHKVRRKWPLSPEFT